MDIIGTDILIVDGNYVDDNGELKTVSDIDLVLQDIKNEMITYPGDLFYDETYGYGLLDFKNSQNTDLARLELSQRIKNKLAINEYVNVSSIIVNISTWNMNNIQFNVQFQLGTLNISLGIQISDSIEVEVISIG